MAKLMGRSDTESNKASAAESASPAPLSVHSYLPPGSLMKKMVRRQTAADGKDMVTLPTLAFRKLLEAAAANQFDAAAYLEKFADVRDAVETGKIASAIDHFVSDGYFEGRNGLSHAVDEAWYLKTYPDVALAIKSGKVRNGAHHYEVFGFSEGRVPNKSLQKTVAEWRDLEKKFTANE